MECQQGLVHVAQLAISWVPSEWTWVSSNPLPFLEITEESSVDIIIEWWDKLHIFWICLTLMLQSLLQVVLEWVLGT